MEYTVMARRFRPQAFGEVVGQEAIAQALRNAIAAGRVAHAYLFTGARGVGKTSTVRILAKTLNCAATQGGDPCNACEICRGIAEGGDVDVIEIDGASNRGIDEIRSLRANVNVRPMRSKYKIYIIDEVHMLTKEAFNALLKTLEEPPPNVKFVFCTTDPQKLPDTILSRCQRFDFGTIETHRIRQRLAEIAQSEGVEVEPAAIDLVARRAAGSMRDSQSLFDQLLAFGGPKVVVADVHRLLGTAPDSRLVEMVRALAQRDRLGVLTQLEQALVGGVQAAEFTDQLIGCCRDLMVLTAGADQAGLLAVGDDVRAELLEIGKGWGLQSILAALQILADTKQRMKQVSYGRVLLELGLIRIATLADLEMLAEAVAQLRSGKLPAAVAGSRPQPEGAEKKNDSAGSLTGGPAPSLGNGRGPGVGQAPRQEASSTGAAAAPAARPATADNSPQTPPEPTGPASNGGAGSLPAGVVGAGAGGTAEGRRPDAGGQPGTLGERGPGDVAVEGQEGHPDRGPDRGGTSGLAGAWKAGQAADVWLAILGELPESPRMNFWRKSTTAILGPNRLVVTLPSWYAAFKENLARTPEHVRELEQVAERLVGQAVRVEIELGTAPPPSEEGGGPRPGSRAGERPSPVDLDKNRPLSIEPDSYVQSAMAAFNAEVVRIDRVEATPAPTRD